MPLTPSHLGDVLPALSEQLGVRVAAEKGLEKFPVNPFFFTKSYGKGSVGLDRAAVVGAELWVSSLGGPDSDSATVD